MTTALETDDPQGARVRWALYAVLIAVAVGQWGGRILAVDSVDRALLEETRVRERMEEFRAELAAAGDSPQEIEQTAARKEREVRDQLGLSRPFLSSNDRSRWLAVRALVELGVWEIDELVDDPGWDTIDMVKHDGHYYSSKPPLLIAILAAPYWVVTKATGMTMGTHPFVVGRIMLILVSVLPFAAMLCLVAAVAERLGATAWGRVFVVACAAFGTMLSAFAIALNNHLVAAVAAAAALYCWLRVRRRETNDWRLYALCGVAAAFTAANELPALAFLVGVWLSLLVHDWRRTLAAFTPAALVVVAAFFAANYAAHDSLRPPYMHRSETEPDDNWYAYTYTRNGVQRESYWLNPEGIDRGEPSRAAYALHTLVGHHGVFSLTPVWVLSIAGALAWLVRARDLRWELAFGVLGLSIVVLTFYIGLRPQEDRNYGGMTSGFRWMFWFAPLWLAAMQPAADWAARSRAAQALALVLLVFSALSASYPTWNPWTQPWIYRWMEWSGFELL